MDLKYVFEMSYKISIKERNVYFKLVIIKIVIVFHSIFIFYKMSEIEKARKI